MDWQAFGWQMLCVQVKNPGASSGALEGGPGNDRRARVARVRERGIARAQEVSGNRAWPIDDLLFTWNVYT
jgi:hypothetical protein